MPSPSRRRPVRRLLRVLALAALALVLLAELGLRAWIAWTGLDVDAVFGRAHPEGGLYVPHPFIGYVLRPEPGSPDNNALGLRGPEVAPDKPPGVVRVLCLGGSTTYGSGLRADEAYPARLQQLLQAAAPPGVRYEVLNAGVPGWTSIESLIAFETRLVELQPDGVVVYHGINDARLVQSAGWVPDNAHVRRAWRAPAISAPEWWLLRHSRAYAWLAHELGRGLKSVRLEDLIFVDDADALGLDGARQGVNQAGVDAFVRNVAHIAALARAAGAEPLLCTFSMRHLPDRPGPPSVHAPAVESMNAGLQQLALREGLAIAEVAGALDARPELFQDVVHLNAQGTAAQARVVYDAARAAGLWGLR